MISSIFKPDDCSFDFAILINFYIRNVDFQAHDTHTDIVAVGG